MSAKNGTFSVIGQDVTITGDIIATTELHVDGTIRGDIKCASLVQGESSHIEGEINAESARMSGTVKGAITARDLVILQTAKVEGDVQYDSLTIEQGATIDGQLSHRVPGSESTVPSALVGKVDAVPASRNDHGNSDDTGEPKLSLAT